MTKLTIITSSIVYVLALTSTAKPITLTLLLCSLIITLLWAVVSSSTIAFLPLTLVIAYMGGVLMLFLFVVILFEIDSQYSATPFQQVSVYLFGIFVAIQSSLIISNYADAARLNSDSELFNFCVNWDVLSITNMLYEYFTILFLASCWLLLIALLGAVTIAVRSTLVFATFWVPGDLTFIGIFFIVVLVVACLLVTIAYILSKSYAPLHEKLSEYECGFEPFDNATKLPFDVHFYIIGVLFLIFDIEIVLMLPWVLKVQFSSIEFNVMLVFILILLIGFIYEWYNGILQWPTRTFNTPQNYVLKLNGLSPSLPPEYILQAGETYVSKIALKHANAKIYYTSSEFQEMTKKIYAEAAEVKQQEIVAYFKALPAELRAKVRDNVPVEKKAIFDTLCARVDEGTVDSTRLTSVTTELIDIVNIAARVDASLAELRSELRSLSMELIQISVSTYKQYLEELTKYQNTVWSNHFPPNFGKEIKLQSIIEPTVFEQIADCTYLNPFFIGIVLVLIPLVIKLISIIISVAYYTVAERKLMAAVQRRKGPNVVGIWGLLQPLADGGKLILKQVIIPTKAKAAIYLSAPVIIFVLSVTAWIVIPGFSS